MVPMTSQLSIPKIILDTDPGGDDIFAFLWLQSLAKQGFAELVAVTTADGNVSARQTFSNASQILELGGFVHIEIGRGVPVKGKAANDASHIHGADGMGNLSKTLPAAAHKYETARYSDEIIIDKLNANPGEITLVAIGPLTNLAAAQHKSPGILKKAREIVIMAGAFHCPGNITPHAEFNIWFNPEAAQTVFNSRDDIVVMPLDITKRLIFTTDMAQTLSQVNLESEISRFLCSLCEFMIETALAYRETGRASGFLVHDAAALGYLFYPQTLFLQRAKVRIETKGEWTRGQTLIDSRHSPQAGANAWVALQVNDVGFFTNFIEDLKYLIKVAAKQ
jgi:inosine-uridine nucleoside N-ribohydrolase